MMTARLIGTGRYGQSGDGRIKIAVLLLQSGEQGAQRDLVIVVHMSGRSQRPRGDIRQAGTMRGILQRGATQIITFSTEAHKRYRKMTAAEGVATLIDA